MPHAIEKTQPHATKRQTVPVKRVVTEVNALESEVDAVKHLQAKTTDELGALLPALLARNFKGDP